MDVGGVTGVTSEHESSTQTKRSGMCCEDDTKRVCQRPHMPDVPSEPFKTNPGGDLEMIWGRMNGLDEAIAVLQHGHNLLASTMEELRACQHAVASA